MDKALFMSLTFNDYFNFTKKNLFVLFMSLMFHKRLNVVILINAI